MATRTRNPDWKAAIWAGIIAGAVFVVLEMLMVPLFLGGSPWAPPAMIAAIVMGPDVLPAPGGPPAAFDLGTLIVAVLVHFALSIAYALFLAWIIAGRSLGLAITIGAALGLALYLINFYGFTALFPWFADARNWVSVFSHIAFGGIAGLAYNKLEQRKLLARPQAEAGDTSDRMAAD